jgi:hypothetical protein
LNDDLPGANLSTIQTVYVMDLCPFNTVASETGAISPFCSLFSEDEWHQYNYYMVSPYNLPTSGIIMMVVTNTTPNRPSTNTTATPTATP